MVINCPACHLHYDIPALDCHSLTVICDFCEVHFDISLPERHWYFWKKRKITIRDSK